MNVVDTDRTIVTGARLSDRSPDEGLGSSIAAPQGSLRSSLSRRIESNDTDRSVDIIEGSDADRAGEADVSTDIATVADDIKEPDIDTVDNTAGLPFGFTLGNILVMPWLHVK